MESSKIQAVTHVGAVMSGEEEKGEMMQLRESASPVKRRRVPSNHFIVASWLYNNMFIIIESLLVAFV